MSNGLQTHPETLIEEAVDDGISEATGHSEPVTRVEQPDEKPLVVPSLDLVKQTRV